MKVAKLVAVSLLTRVIVDDTATEREIINLAKNQLISQLENDIHDNVEYVKNDEAYPFDPETEGYQPKFSNQNLQFDLEKIRGYETEEIKIGKFRNDNHQTIFTIEVADNSYFYNNKEDRDKDFIELIS